tara:strand:+ start:414 stop:1151 length:738 start_codon:yes stop_codon:yes gene_type:complete
MHRLDGKKAVITAAAQGMGRAIAKAFADEGATVYASDINKNKINEISSKNKILTTVCDVTDNNSIGEFLDFSGTPDILFNCAGFVAEGTILDATEEEWDKSFNINVKSMFRMIKTFLPSMINNGGGSIINMASLASNLSGIPNRAIYTSSKAAVVGLTKSVARDYLEKKIRVNAIAPATVETPSLQDRINNTDNPIETRKSYIARQPMGRIGTPEEVASLAVYLASDESSYMTGQTIVIDGAMSL